jgi:hypothetical protein
MKDEYSSGSGGGHYVYYAIMRFRTEKNMTVEFKDNVGSNPPPIGQATKSPCFIFLAIRDKPSLTAVSGGTGRYLESCFYPPHLLCGY